MASLTEAIPLRMMRHLQIATVNSHRSHLRPLAALHKSDQITLVTFTLMVSMANPCHRPTEAIPSRMTRHLHIGTVNVHQVHLLPIAALHKIDMLLLVKVT